MRPTVCFAVLACAVLPALGSRTADPTARAGVTQAAAAAKQWRTDAVLTHVSSLTVNPDGTAKSWMYTFYAPKSKHSLNVTFARGSPLDTLQVPNTSMVPIGDAFVDSDRAMQEAKKHGLKGDSPSMGLVVMGFTGAPVWAVNGGFSEGDVSVILNGNTGAFIRTDTLSYK